MQALEQTGKPLVSEFADDPDMLEIIVEFVSDLADRVESIKAAVTTTNAAEIQRIAHQLKGAAGGYGFPVISDAAAQVENLLKPVEGSEPKVEHAAQQIEILLNYCLAAVAGPQTGDGSNAPAVAD